MKYYRAISILFTLLFLTNCQTMNETDQATLDEDQGFLLCSVEANALKWELSLFDKKNHNNPFGMAEAVFHFDTEYRYILIKLREGDYTFKYIYNKPFAFELDTEFFSIKPGVVNYIGKLDINVIDDDPYFPEFNYRYVDDYDVISEYFASEYPVISSTFEVNIDSLITTTVFKKPIQKM